MRSKLIDIKSEINIGNLMKIDDANRLNLKQ